MHKYLILFVIVTVISISCNNDSKPSNNFKPKTEQTKPNKSKNQKGHNWTIIKKDLQLSGKQVNSLKSIISKHSKQITDLKKEGKWLGNKNSQRRKNINNAKENKIKKLLGNKYKSWQRYINDRNIANQAAKKK